MRALPGTDEGSRLRSFLRRIAERPELLDELADRLDEPIVDEDGSPPKKSDLEFFREAGCRRRRQRFWRKTMQTPYAVQYRKSAYAERRSFTAFTAPEPVTACVWAQPPCRAEAAAREGKISVEVDPEEWIRTIENLKSNWARWWETGVREKVHALLHVIKNRTPPWEFRYAQHELRLLDNVTDTIDAWYEVDHAGKRVVITKLDLPPRD